MTFTAKILLWRFRPLNIVCCLLKRRPTKRGSRAPRTAPLATPLDIISIFPFAYVTPGELSISEVVVHVLLSDPKIEETVTTCSLLAFSYWKFQDHLMTRGFTNEPFVNPRIKERCNTRYSRKMGGFLFNSYNWAHYVWQNLIESIHSNRNIIKP